VQINYFFMRILCPRNYTHTKLIVTEHFLFSVARLFLSFYKPLMIANVLLHYSNLHSFRNVPISSWLKTKGGQISILFRRFIGTVFIFDTEIYILHNINNHPVILLTLFFALDFTKQHSSSLCSKSPS